MAEARDDYATPAGALIFSDGGAFLGQLKISANRSRLFFTRTGGGVSPIHPAPRQVLTLRRELFVFSRHPLAIRPVWILEQGGPEDLAGFPLVAPAWTEEHTS